MGKIRDTAKILSELWAVYLAILGAVILFISLYKEENNFGVVVALSVFSSVCLIKIVSQTIVISRTAKNVSPIRFLKKHVEINAAVNERLRGVRDCLHYYGAAGFVSDNSEWKDLLELKLRDPSIKVHRLLHLKKPEELREPFTNAFGHEGAEEKIRQYKELLKTHARNLSIRSNDNYFYNFEGAPFWRYGLNHIVFDRKSVVMVAPSEERRRKVIIIDSQEIASEIADSIEWIIRVLQPNLLTERDVLELTKE